MDLLGDIGNTDQLVSARAEISILTEKVKQLKVRVAELTVENETLKAEVEIYRKEAALPNFSALALGGQGNHPQAAANTTSNAMDADNNNNMCDDFVRSGDGISFPSIPEITLNKLHGLSNPLCCALSSDDTDTMLATGGADSHLNLCQWRQALSLQQDAVAEQNNNKDQDQINADVTNHILESSMRTQCPAPVICTSFAPGSVSALNSNHLKNVVVAGCMDGAVQVVHFETPTFGAGKIQQVQSIKAPGKHTKYIKDCVWSPTQPIFASASADGTLNVYKVTQNLLCANPATESLHVECIETLHLPGPVESVAFINNGDTLCCYSRGTPYLSYFDLNQNFQQTKINLNQNATGGFEDHVSFCVMDIVPSPAAAHHGGGGSSGKYLALATDTSRNIVIDSNSGFQIRNLYGHQNDGFSQPKVGWSKSGQYLLGNTQNDTTVCVWDIASSKIIKHLNGGHTQTVRDLYCSANTDTMVTTSYDKQTKIWMKPISSTATIEDDVVMKY